MTDNGSLTESLDALRDGYLTLCRLLEGAPGIAWADDGDLAWGMTSMPIGAFNRISRIRLGDGTADVRIAEMIDRYETAGLPSTWWVDPQATPTDLASRFERRDFKSEAVPAMRIEADDVLGLDLPAGVTLSWATDPLALRAAMQLVAQGFGLPDDLGNRMADMIAPLARSDGPMRTAVARLDGKPVASAQGTLVGRAVAIYNVATLGEARGRGIGAAVTTAVLRDAVTRGARFGVLESSTMGHGVYERIGFRDVATLRVYGPAES